MILESISIIVVALVIDFIVGDPRNKYHPTAWIGSFVSRLVILLKTTGTNHEKFKGAVLVIVASATIIIILMGLEFSLNNLGRDIVSISITILVGAILLKTTIAIKGMEKHAISVIESIEKNDIEAARNYLSRIVKRDTKNLDKRHIISGVLESVSENIVDGITGPIFYFSIFGLVGAFVYRTINTIDSMIGYKTDVFVNIGWFGANCDKILNFIPARLTAIVMIISSAFLGLNWRNSYQIMVRDSRKLESPNAGYPMSVMAGALETRFEKIDHYKIGDEKDTPSKESIYKAIRLLKVTVVLFCLIVSFPIIIVLTYAGWWFHA